MRSLMQTSSANCKPSCTRRNLLLSHFSWTLHPKPLGVSTQGSPHSHFTDAQTKAQRGLPVVSSGSFGHTRNGLLTPASDCPFMVQRPQVLAALTSADWVPNEPSAETGVLRSLRLSKPKGPKAPTSRLGPLSTRPRVLGPQFWS